MSFANEAGNVSAALRGVVGVMHNENNDNLF